MKISVPTWTIRYVLYLVAEILVHAVGVDGGMEPQQRGPGERHCDQEGELLAP